MLVIHASELHHRRRSNVNLGKAQEKISNVDEKAKMEW